MALSRRSMLVGGGVALLGASVPLSRLFGRPRTVTTGRFGPLKADPAGIFDLPDGFSYRVIQRSGGTTADGYKIPGCFDGMGCFEGPNGTWVLMRNHECLWLPLTGPYHPGQSPPPEAFDKTAHGAVTRVVLKAETLEVMSTNLVLAGTVRNCAGGRSPWGWLSCEETTDAGHGYVFLCRTDASRVAPPERIAGYGRFRHEAACVDPATCVAYLTEDEDDGAVYRFVPDATDAPFKGRLQALAVPGKPRFDTSRAMPAGQTVDVVWVDVTDPDPKNDTVRHQAQARGAALLRRGEGIWLEGDELFICSTSGGPRSAGQVFRVSLGRAQGPDRLTLLAESNDTDALNMPDNLTVAPWGEIFLAEDSVVGTQHVRILSPDGRVSTFGRNALSRSELAGVCFSPDGTCLFVNIYGDGLTLAVRGPFRSA
jgi:secreted PhoX family phosphatase